MPRWSAPPQLGYYAGKLDDIRVYNRALSAAEVGTLPNGSGASGAQLKWVVADQLGTPRMVLDQSGALVNVKRHDYLPFGEELLAPTGGRTTGQGYAGDGVRQQFTQQERDIETGLDYFLARYYSSPQGRFVSVDPLAASAHVFRPQTWNRYSYVLNNPLRHTDPTGMTVAEYDQMSQAAIETRRWFHAEKQSEQPADTSATSTQKTLTQEDPKTISSEGSQSCQFTISFESGTFYENNPNLPNGPGDVHINGTTYFGLGFTVSGVTRGGGGIGRIGSQVNPSNPKGQWTLDQYTSSYAKQNGKFITIDGRVQQGGNAWQDIDLRGYHFATDWTSKFSRYDHPALRAGVADAFKNQAFLIKVFRGNETCQAEFHIVQRGNELHWGKGGQGVWP